MASPTLITPTPKPAPPIRSRITATFTPTTTTTPATSTVSTTTTTRRHLLSLSTGTLLLSAITRPAWAASDEDYVKDTEEVIGKVKNTINLDKTDPKVADAVAELRETSNAWVAKYRKEKALLGRASFRDMYSALNAVSGHYISFGPTAPIPAKRKQRILEEVETAEKALLRGR
ncbi:hypothetical protein CASFOL_025303 [Castilleja foliolosa]|uniref:Photosystem II repair protein PSB27-H1, chloroplastic n=1 Tax=Castilleja foliolosa TaxID=1961234 RepID=A0ABD3CT09_9LAMI